MDREASLKVSKKTEKIKKIKKNNKKNCTVKKKPLKF
jgi:hypothetical protein